MKKSTQILIKFILLVILIVCLWTFIHFKICVKYNQKNIFNIRTKNEEDNKDDEDDEADNNKSNKVPFIIYENNRIISHV